MTIETTATESAAMQASIDAHFGPYLGADEPATEYPLQYGERVTNPRLLLIRAINSIIAHPDNWNQEVWHCKTSRSGRCGTIHCFYGWIENHYFGREVIGIERQAQYIMPEHRAILSPSRPLRQRMETGYTLLVLALIFGTQDMNANEQVAEFVELSETHQEFTDLYGWVCDFVGFDAPKPDGYLGWDSKSPPNYAPIPESFATA